MPTVRIRQVIGIKGVAYEMVMPMKGKPDSEEKELTLDQVFANLLMYYEGRHPAHFGDEYGRIVVERARGASKPVTGKRDIRPEDIEAIKKVGKLGGLPDEPPTLSKPGEPSEVLNIGGKKEKGTC